MSEGKIKYDVDKGITECKELISIFVRSIKTARKNKSSKNT